MSDRYICDECKFTRSPHEHKCYDRSKCQCDHCTIVDLKSELKEAQAEVEYNIKAKNNANNLLEESKRENARLKEVIKTPNECTCPSCGVHFVQQILSVKQAEK